MQKVYHPISVRYEKYGFQRYRVYVLESHIGWVRKAIEGWEFITLLSPIPPATSKLSNGHKTREEAVLEGLSFLFFTLTPPADKP